MRRRRIFRILCWVVVIPALVFGIRIVVMANRMDARARTSTTPGPDNSQNADILLKSKLRILMIAAHPDDSDFYAGGTLARLAKRGDDITLLVITTGGKEKYGVRSWSNYLKRTRRAEQIKAGQILGYHDIIFWDYPDGKLPPYHDELVPKLRDVIDKINPEIVLAYDFRHPWGYGHPDHMTAGLVAVEALEDRNPRPELFFYASSRPNTWIDVSNTLELKWESLRAHSSQFSLGRMYLIKNHLLGKLAEREGVKIGTAAAETFRKED